MPETGSGAGIPPGWPMGQSQGDALKSAESFLNKGLDHHDRGEYDEAIQCYQKAIELAPGLVVAHNNLGMVWIDKGMFKEAIASLERAVELDPNYAEAYNNLGFAYRRLGDEPRAAAYYEKFLELEPDVEDAPKIRAWLEQVKAKFGALPPIGQKSQAIPQAPQRPEPPAVAAPKPQVESVESLCEKGISALEKGDLAAAEQTLRRAIALSPDSALAHSAMGRVLAKAGRYEEAVAELRQAVSLDPADAAAHYVLGFALRSLNMDVEAAEAYERYLELTPDAPEGPQIRTWIAEVRAAELSPEALYSKALNMFQDGALDEALELCEHIIAQDDSHVPANILLGRILLQKGDYIRAVPALKRAERAKPDDPEIHFYLGQAYEKRGLLDEARAAYEKCLAVAPSGPRAESIKKWLEKASGVKSAAGVRCEYCFRSFPAEKLSTHDGKRICPDCLANLGATVASPQVTETLQQTVVERTAADEAARERLERRKAALGRFALLAFLSLLLAFGTLLLFLRYGWLEGPFQRIGLYAALRRIGLEGPLETIGIVLPQEPPKTSAEVPIRPAQPQRQRPERPLSAVGPRSPLSVAPLGRLKARISAEGGHGEPSFKLKSGPKGLRLDAKTGEFEWRPGLELTGSRHDVEIEVSAGEEKSSVKFTVAVYFGLEPTPPVGVGAGPGDELRLAVYRSGPVRSLIAASGRYRRGRLTFVPSGRWAPLGGAPSGLAVADFTGDGRADVVVSDWFGRRLVLFEVDDQMTPKESISVPLRFAADDISAGDLDGDGIPEVLASHWSAGIVSVCQGRLLSGKRDGAATPVEYPAGPPSGWNRIFAPSASRGPALALLVCGSGDGPALRAFRVLKGGTLASFVDAAGGTELPGRPSGGAILRVEGAGTYLGLLFGGGNPRIAFFAVREERLERVWELELGQGIFPLSMAAGDLTGDGSDDLVVVCPEELRIFMCAGDGRLEWLPVNTGPLRLPGAVGPVCIGEFTGDERADVAVALDDGTLQILRSRDWEEERSP